MAMEGGSPVLPCAELSPKVHAIVEAAWQEAGQQAQSQLDPRHQADLKADRELGAEYAAMVEKEEKVSTNQAYIDRLQRIGGEIARIANSNQVSVSWGDPRLNPFAYEFKVLEGKEVNAFSLPGGYLYFYEGLMAYAESDDELAGVVAHEISHSSFRHLATLSKEQSKFDTMSIPMILAALILKGDAGMGVLVLRDLVGLSSKSGWSVKAELAADYGAFQYMRMSPYNPVGMLTFMERLAKDQRALEAIDWGIYRTHPPSRDRADRLTKYLKEAKIPILRSEVSSSFRAQVRPAEPGFEIVFGGRRIHLFGGAQANARAVEALKRLNTFFDAVPDLYEVQAGPDGVVLGRRKALFVVTQEDAEALGLMQEDATEEAVRSIKRSLYMLAYRIWDIR
ncbi:MAG: Peptidase family M48 [Armatimonadetes bacterium OLB18]|nr:MAG: Peptidase family M48 [Armatimonadetes bacterium OLB18]